MRSSARSSRARTGSSPPTSERLDDTMAASSPSPTRTPTPTALAVDFDALGLGDATITRGRTITEADIVGFANLTGDRHPVHTDAEWAAESRFEGRIGHGLLGLAYGSGLISFDPDTVVALRSIKSAVFKKPVRIGDTVYVEATVLGKKVVDVEHGLVECSWKLRNQHDELLTFARVEVLWRRSR